MRNSTRTIATPKTLVIRALSRLLGNTHRWLYRLTGGAIGSRFRGGQVLLLTTLGRKSGRPHTWPLIYFQDGLTWVIVGSNSGLDQHPAWLLNLRHHAQAQIEIGRQRLSVNAREVEGAEWDRLWQLVIRSAPFYDGYRQSTRRHIPLMILAPLAQENHH